MKLTLVLIGLCALSMDTATAESSALGLNDRIARIENGLRQAVVVRGAPERTMRLADRMRALEVPGLSIAVINHGAVEWSRAYGVADVSTGRPVTTDTLFQAASISKPVTAVGLMRLAAAGELNLDEDVNRRLRDWKVPAADGVTNKFITPRMLLSHTAGMPEIGMDGYAADGPLPSLLQVLRGAAPATNPPARIESAPGERYAYSSLGYAVLQQYASDVTGRPFGALLDASVLKPAGMTSSVFTQSLPPSLSQRAALGHELDGSVTPGGWRRYPELAAAGLWTTATDLAKFAIAIQHAAQGTDTRLLTQKQAETMLTPVRGDYGLGFELDHDGREKAFHHSGSNRGYKALMFAYERTGQGAVILTNGDGGWPLIEEVMRSIAAEYRWEDFHPIARAAVRPNLTLFDRFVGDFNVSNVVLHVSRKDDQIFLSGPPLGPDPVELIPSGDYDFFIREKDATLHFDEPANGPVQTLTFVDGRPRPGVRTLSKPAN
jgi:CubicO group peptidase (beta-lactamase class C family)